MALQLCRGVWFRVENLPGGLIWNGARLRRVGGGGDDMTRIWRKKHGSESIG
jgi:hypothetical protein